MGSASGAGAGPVSCGSRAVCRPSLSRLGPEVRPDGGLASSGGREAESGPCGRKQAPEPLTDWLQQLCEQPGQERWPGAAAPPLKNAFV